MSVLPKIDRNVCLTQDRQECLSYPRQTGMSVLLRQIYAINDPDDG
jgi:phage FluMu protein gp41